jgi:hypothetical protein
MAINIFTINYDLVIKSTFITAQTNYEFAINSLVPLINKLEIQRKIQDKKFYQRLEKDLLRGCILPPLTIAFIDNSINSIKPKEIEFEKYINDNIESAFVLDGIQRLNTLSRAFQSSNNKLDLNRPLFLNILFCSSMDNLLYRMITLNNGQKPMTATHQIEILASNIYEFEDSPITIQTEKERGKKAIRGSFKKAHFIKAYIAFLSNSINIDNQRIIEEKMEELIADKILDSDITNDNLEFSEILLLINRFCEDKDTLKWFNSNENNLIGFSVGIRNSFNFLEKQDKVYLKSAIDIFEEVFKSFDPSKIRVGQQRRKLINYFISNIEHLQDKTENEILDELSQI